MSKLLHARVRAHRKVKFQHAQGKGEGTLLDLTLKGYRIKGVYTGSSGTRLRLQLWLPDHSQPVKVEIAAVQWIRDTEFGVSLLKLSPDAQGRLAQVFRMLHEAQQQADARTIPIAPSAIIGSGEKRRAVQRAEDSGSPWTSINRALPHCWRGGYWVVWHQLPLSAPAANRSIT